MIDKVAARGTFANSPSENARTSNLDCVSHGRAEFIDVARGITILLVVLTHNSVMAQYGHFLEPLRAFRMPLFFFISGLFLPYRRGLRNFLLGKADSLLKPYFTTCVLIAVALAFTGGLHVRGYFLGVLYGSGMTLFWPPLWFLPHLFVVVFCSWFFVRLFSLNYSSPKQWTYILVPLLVIGYCFPLYFQEFTINYRGKVLEMGGWPWNLDLLGRNCFFCLLGFSVRNKIQPAGTATEVCLHGTIFAGLSTFLQGSTMREICGYDNLFAATIQALSGIFFVLSISKWLTRSVTVPKILAYVGSGSLFVLIWHWPVQNAVTTFLRLKYYAFPEMTSALSFIWAVVLPLILWEIVLRNRQMRLIFLPLKATPHLMRPIEPRCAVKCDTVPAGE